MNATKQGGFTALMLAAEDRRTATVVLLAQECGADVDAIHKDDFTALMSAAQNGHTATVVELLHEYGANLNVAKQKGITVTAHIRVQ